ncbi:MAG TPA: hypothetical protein VEW71_04020 [Allosphingosinicella sp.]|nr:hypothetical protein [Allosphingosinicella sp.]
MIRADSGDELERAICASFGRLPATLKVEERSSRPWASITFAGARHRLRLSLRGPSAAASADAFLAGLPEREFDLRGHFMADIALIEDVRGDGSVRLTLEALTVEAS